MTKHAKKSDHLQAVDLPKTMAVEIPLPLLGAFANIERSFFEFCIDAGQQVLGAMMESRIAKTFAVHAGSEILIEEPVAPEGREARSPSAAVASRFLDLVFGASRERKSCFQALPSPRSGIRLIGIL